MRFGSVTNCFNEKDLIGGCLDLMDVEIKIVIISDITYQGNKLKHDNSESIALKRGTIVLRVRTADQSEMRNLGITLLRGMGIDYAFIVDSDEWWSKQALEEAKRFIEDTNGLAYKKKMICSFRNPSWAVQSPTDGGSIVCLKTSEKICNPRRNSELTPIVEIPGEGKIYHLSYARTPKKILEKIKNFSHANEIIEGWYENVYLKASLGSQNIHPTNSESWPSLYEIDFPREIKSKIPKKLYV